MSFFRALLGRSKPVRPDLDALFGLPSAAVTLEAAAGFRPTGTGSVAFRAAEGKAFADLEREVNELLNADDGPAVEPAEDEYGYTWLVLRTVIVSVRASPTCNREGVIDRPTDRPPIDNLVQRNDSTSSARNAIASWLSSSQSATSPAMAKASTRTSSPDALAVMVFEPPCSHHRRGAARVRPGYGE